MAQASQITSVDTQAPCVLAVDVANQITRFGLFSEDSLQASWSIITPALITTDEAHLAVMNFLDNIEFDCCCDEEEECCVVSFETILSCVVPDLSNTWLEALQSMSRQRPLVVGPGIKTGLPMKYNDPSEVGSDRIADMVASKKLFGFPLISIDCDTTINLQVLDREGAYVGGLIVPGLSLSAKILAQTAARLPIVELSIPATVLGKNTRESIQSGIIRGEAARIDGLIDMIWQELAYETTLVLSGETAALLASLLQHEVLIDDNLTLTGLYELYKLNRK